MLVDIEDEEGNKLTDHLWFNVGKKFENLKIGDKISFFATVKEYWKGTKKNKLDYKLAYPCKIEKITENKTYYSNDLINNYYIREAVDKGIIENTDQDMIFYYNSILPILKKISFKFYKINRNWYKDFLARQSYLLSFIERENHLQKLLLNSLQLEIMNEVEYRKDYRLK